MNKFLLMDEELGDGAGGETGAGGGDAANWYDGFPEDIRSNQNVTKFESAEVMAKSWINAQHMIGADKIPMPQSEEDWGNVYSRLGRPDEANMYAIDPVEGFEVNEEQQNAFKEFAFGQGLSQNQIQALATWDMERQTSAGTASEESAQAALDEAQNSLKSEWGEAHEQNVNIAARTAAEFMGDEGKAFFENAKIDGIPAGEHPALLKLFHSVGKGMMEPGKLEGIANEGKQTPQEIEDSRNALMANPAYMDRNHPEHAAVKRKVEAAFKLQFG